MVNTSALIPTDDLSVYPNTFSEELYIERASLHSTPIRIFDAPGRIYLEDILQKKQHRLSTTDWPEGVYFILIGSENRAISLVKH